MPNTIVPAAGEAMPAAKMNRRSLLAGLAAASSAAAVPIAASAAKAENPKLLQLASDLSAAVFELESANEDKDWIVAEWKHLWPLAPEEILGGSNSWEMGNLRDSAETNIAGEPIYRLAALLTKRLSRQFRTGDKAKRMLNFAVDRPDDLRERYDSWLSKPAKSKTKTAQRSRILAELEVSIPLAEEYHAETARLRKVSGIEDAKVRIEQAKRAIEQATTAIMTEEACTVEGIVIKAQALQTGYALTPFGHADFDDHPLGWGAKLAASIISVSAAVGHEGGQGA